MRRSRIRRLSAILGSVPSLVWGCCYLVCVPVFALLYMSQPWSFYHATAMHEREIEIDQMRLEDELQEEIKANFLAVHHSLEIDTPEGRLSVSSIPVFFYGMPAERQNEYEFSFDSLDAVVHAKMGSYESPDHKWVYEVTISGNALAARHPGLAFPCRDMPGFDAHERVPSGACMLVPEDLMRDINDLFNNKNGFPRWENHFWTHFWRMVYFSAVTISTLGYGDIVPLTQRARGLVTVEVVFGPILFGLFLNSLIRETKAADPDAERN